MQGWYFGNQIFNAIIAGKDFFREELPWSLVVYYVVFVACSIVFIPYGPFCIAIGFIFGVYWGFLIQMGAILLSSAVLFIIGRYLFKDYVSTHAAPSALQRSSKEVPAFLMTAERGHSVISTFSLVYVAGERSHLEVRWLASLEGSDEVHG